MNKNTEARVSGRTKPVAFDATVAPKIGAGNFTQDLDLSLDELNDLLALTGQVKRSPRDFRDALDGKYLSILFEKPSLRTRFTFELAIKQLGGDCVTSSGPIAAREPLKDVARNLERWTQCIVARTFTQQTIDELAWWASIPVVNALSDLYHPCQALADVFTLKEQFGDLWGTKLAFVGDGNNVAHSLMLDAPRLGMDFAIATPAGYEPNSDVIAEAEGLAAVSGTKFVVTTNPDEAVAGANAVYTDVWASMGHEGEAERRRMDFGPYQVTLEMLEKAGPDAVFMHCLPAKRGEETVDEVIESPRSVVFDQAENRLHTQKALLLMLLA